MSTDDVSRRTFMRTAGGAAAAAGVAAGAPGTAVGQEDNGEEDNGEAEDGEEGEGEADGGGGDVVPSWPTAVENGNLGTYEDARGREEVTVLVGADDDGLAFDATQLWVDPGTTVTWEWTGQGGGHNVETVEGPAELGSEVTDEEGFTYSYEVTEDDEGITHYYCAPHDAVGMHAGLAVGEDIETEDVGDGGGAGAVFVPQGARALGIATFIAMVSTLGLAFVFMKYGGTMTED